MALSSNYSTTISRGAAIYAIAQLIVGLGFSAHELQAVQGLKLNLQGGSDLGNKNRKFLSISLSTASKAQASSVKRTSSEVAKVSSDQFPAVEHTSVYWYSMSQALQYNEKTYYFYTVNGNNAHDNRHNYDILTDFFNTMESDYLKNSQFAGTREAAYKGFGGLEFAERSDEKNTDGYYISFVTAEPIKNVLELKKEELKEKMIMFVGSSCWENFRVYENRGISRSLYKIDSESRQEHRHLSLPLQAYTAKFMMQQEWYTNSDDKRKYLFVSAWYTMAAIIYKQAALGWHEENTDGIFQSWSDGDGDEPKLYTQFKPQKMTELCTSLFEDAENVAKLKKMVNFSNSRLSDLSRGIVPETSGSYHPIFIVLRELANAYKFRDF